MRLAVSNIGWTEAHDATIAGRLRDAGADARAGQVKWDPAHSLWNGTMLAAAVFVGPFVFSWQAFALFLVMTGGAVLLGHSIGFHRLLIHRSFATFAPIRYFLIWCGKHVFQQCGTALEMWSCLQKTSRRSIT